MTLLATTKLSIPEAAFVADVTVRAIEHEMDERIMPSSRGNRFVSGADLVYLRAIREVRRELAPSLRRQLRNAIAEALDGLERFAKVGHLQVAVTDVARDVRRDVEWLDKVKGQFVESSPAIMGGEPVLRGTRIPTRLVADLVKTGASHQEIGDELDLSQEQIDAAVTYDRVKPRRGRPSLKRREIFEHVPADR